MTGAAVMLVAAMVIGPLTKCSATAGVGVGEEVGPEGEDSMEESGRRKQYSRPIMPIYASSYPIRVCFFCIFYFFFTCPRLVSVPTDGRFFSFFLQ